MRGKNGTTKVHPELCHVRVQEILINILCSKREVKITEPGVVELSNVIVQQSTLSVQLNSVRLYT